MIAHGLISRQGLYTVRSQCPSLYFASFLVRCRSVHLSELRGSAWYYSTNVTGKVSGLRCFRCVKHCRHGMVGSHKNWGPWRKWTWFTQGSDGWLTIWEVILTLNHNWWSGVRHFTILSPFSTYYNFVKIIFVLQIRKKDFVAQIHGAPHTGIQIWDVIANTCNAYRQLKFYLEVLRNMICRWENIETNYDVTTLTVTFFFENSEW